MPKTKTKLAKFFNFLFLISPLILCFSYYPIITLGHSDSMNLELSLPLIWLVLYVAVAAILYIKTYKKFPAVSRKGLILCLFPVYLTVSLLWAPNLLRGVLVTGIVWLIWLAVFLSFKLRDFLQPLKSKLVKSIFSAAIIVSAFCWLQSILDVLGVDRSTTLMCKGCVSATFGFPHPNGFAVEPQFMGNLLIAPTLLAIYEFYKKSNAKNFILVLFLATTLFFTFSRGAIYSFAIAIILMLATLIIKQKTARPLLIIPILILSFACSLNAQGLMAMSSPTNDTYASGIIKSLDQLTLGIFDLKINNDSSQTNNDLILNNNDSNQNNKDFNETNNDSYYDGYVEVSTTGRLSISASSLKVWKSTATNFWFGVGIGGTGVALYEAGELDYKTEPGQNEYCTILLELGIVGAIILVITLIVAFKFLPAELRHSPLFASLVLAYAFSILFFSGLPNALHIYLMPIFTVPFIKKEKKS